MSESSLPVSSNRLLDACQQFSRLVAQDGKPPVCFAAVDGAGELLCFHRMDGAPMRLISIAIGKAYTAARMETPTALFQARLAREKLTLADFCDDRYTALPGGIPIRSGNHVVGAVGVSGRGLEDDHALAGSFADIIDGNCAAKPE